MAKDNNKLIFAPIGLFEFYMRYSAFKKLNPSFGAYEVLIIRTFLL